MLYEFYEYRQLLELIRRTGELGESNSILVVGARGSGKTTLIRNVLEELSSRPEVTDNLMEVRLNGKALTIHYYLIFYNNKRWQMIPLFKQKQRAMGMCDHTSPGKWRKVLFNFHCGDFLLDVLVFLYSKSRPFYSI